MKTVRTEGVRSAVWLLAAAIVLVGAFLFGGLRFLGAGSPTRAKEARPKRSSQFETERRAQRPAPAVRRKIVPRSSAGRPISDRPAGVKPAPGRNAALSNVAPGDVPAEEDEPTGIALFPPPGTDPPKSGIIVPEDFALPEGYVRHHQATDDGRPLPPILMFHPDYEFTDENGMPVEIPEDRVVPVEMAPAGLDVRILEVPDVAVPMIEPEGE